MRGVRYGGPQAAAPAPAPAEPASQKKRKRGEGAPDAVRSPELLRHTALELLQARMPRFCQVASGLSKQIFRYFGWESAHP